MASTQPLEGWDKSQREQLAHAVMDEGWARHLPTVGPILLIDVPLCDAPPTQDELAKVIASPTNPTGSWDAPAWEPPEPLTAEELVELRRDFPEWTDPDEPEDPDEVNARQQVDFDANRARIDRYAAHYGLPSIRTCQDTLELLVAAGLLHRVVEGGRGPVPPRMAAASGPRCVPAFSQGASGGGPASLATPALRHRAGDHPPVRARRRQSQREPDHQPATARTEAGP